MTIEKTTIVTSTRTKIDLYRHAKAGTEVVIPANPADVRPLMLKLMDKRLRVGGGHSDERVSNSPAIELPVAMIEEATAADLGKEVAVEAAYIVECSAANKAEKVADAEIKKMTLGQFAQKLNEVSGRKFQAETLTVDGRIRLGIQSGPLSLAHFKALSKILPLNKTVGKFWCRTGILLLDERLALLVLAAEVASAAEVTFDRVSVRQAN